MQYRVVKTAACLPFCMFACGWQGGFGAEKEGCAAPFFIFSLEIYILSLEICVFRLKTCISSVEIELLSLRLDFLSDMDCKSVYAAYMFRYVWKNNYLCLPNWILL